MAQADTLAYQLRTPLSIQICLITLKFSIQKTGLFSYMSSMGKLASNSSHRLDQRKVLEGFRDYKDDSSVIPEDLSPLSNILSLIPVSSAECERGFSLMNIIMCPLRCRLLIENISPLMFVNLNGTPLSKWNPLEYVKSRLVKHSRATDTQTRPCKPSPKVDKEALWALL